MTDAFDLSTLFFLALAVIIFLRLRSVLGRRTGNERPPFDPFSRRDLPAKDTDEKTGDAKVISMPGTPRIQGADTVPDEDEEDQTPVWQGHAEPGTPLAKGIEAIAAIDPDFNPTEFLTGARIAYEEIVKSFAASDRKGLKGLLSPDVYASFDGAITERQKRGETLESSFVGIDKATIVEAATKGRKAMVTVKFVSQLITSTRDSSGTVIDGDPKKVREVVDIWTFMRDAGSRDPNWQLVATESAN